MPGYLTGFKWFWLLLVVGSLMPATPAQQRDWDALYEAAVDLIEAGLSQDAGTGATQWSEAIDLLQQAIVLKPEPQTGRFGMLVARRKKYFPYFYLGVASLRSGRLVQSRESFKKAREFGSVLEDSKLSGDLRRFESLLFFQIGSDYLDRDQPEEALPNLDAARKLGALPAELRKSLDDLIRDANERIATTERRFASLVTNAQTALAAGDFVVALRDFAEAERFDPEEYKRRQLGASKLAAEHGYVDLLLADARKDIDGGSILEAHSKLKQATAILPGRTDIQLLLRDLVGDYPSLKKQGDSAFDQGDWAASLEPYRNALLFFERQAGRDRLDDRIETAIRKLVRESASRLVQGEAQAVIESLEKAVAGGITDVRIHAFLGVAYVKLAFISPDRSQLPTLHTKALEQFRRVRRQDPEYRLPARIISPLIIELFESAGDGG